MVDVSKAVIARIKKEGRHFEVLVDCDAALAFKAGKSISMKDVLADSKVFTDSKKGLVASPLQLKSLFNTDSVEVVAGIIIRGGDIQLTTEHRAKIRDMKKKHILEYIHRNAIDPKTKLPHPLKRLELAMEEAKVTIDEKTPEEKQIQEILKKLKAVIPISFARKEIAIKIPSEYAARSYSAVKLMGKIIGEEWLNDGSLSLVMEIPAGMQDDLFSRLNSLTKGSVGIQILKVKE